MFYAKALYEVATKEAEETGKYFPDNYYNGPELQDFDLYGQPTEERHRISAIRKKQMIKWLMVAGIILAISLLYAFAHAADFSEYSILMESYRPGKLAFTAKERILKDDTGQVVERTSFKKLPKFWKDFAQYFNGRESDILFLPCYCKEKNLIFLDGEDQKEYSYLNDLYQERLDAGE